MRKSYSIFNFINLKKLKKYINEYNEDSALGLAMKETDTTDLVNTDDFLSELKKRSQ